MDWDPSGIRFEGSSLAGCDEHVFDKNRTSLFTENTIYQEVSRKRRRSSWFTESQFS